MDQPLQHRHDRVRVDAALDHHHQRLARELIDDVEQLQRPSLPRSGRTGSRTPTRAIRALGPQPLGRYRRLPEPAAFAPPPRHPQPLLAPQPLHPLAPPPSPAPAAGDVPIPHRWCASSRTSAAPRDMRHLGRSPRRCVERRCRRPSAPRRKGSEKYCAPPQSAAARSTPRRRTRARQAPHRPAREVAGPRLRPTGDESREDRRARAASTTSRSFASLAVDAADPADRHDEEAADRVRPSSRVAAAAVSAGAPRTRGRTALCQRPARSGCVAA